MSAWVTCKRRVWQTHFVRSLFSVRLTPFAAEKALVAEQTRYYGESRGGNSLATAKSAIKIKTPMAMQSTVICFFRSDC
jgi:hypothetical protein